VTAATNRSPLGPVAINQSTAAASDLYASVHTNGSKSWLQVQPSVNGGRVTIMSKPFAPPAGDWILWSRIAAPIGTGGASDVMMLGIFQDDGAGHPKFGDSITVGLLNSGISLRSSVAGTPTVTNLPTGGDGAMRPEYAGFAYLSGGAGALYPFMVSENRQVFRWPSVPLTSGTLRAGWRMLRDTGDTFMVQTDFIRLLDNPSPFWQF